MQGKAHHDRIDLEFSIHDEFINAVHVIGVHVRDYQWIRSCFGRREIVNR